MNTTKPSPTVWYCEESEMFVMDYYPHLPSAIVLDLKEPIQHFEDAISSFHSLDFNVQEVINAIMIDIVGSADPLGSVIATNASYLADAAESEFHNEIAGFVMARIELARCVIRELAPIRTVVKDPRAYQVDRICSDCVILKKLQVPDFDQRSQSHDARNHRQSSSSARDFLMRRLARELGEESRSSADLLREAIFAVSRRSERAGLGVVPFGRRSIR